MLRLYYFNQRNLTNRISHCLVGKYLASLLYPLTTNEFSLKDSFDAANRIKVISSYLLENGYQYVSIDVKSLFTNVSVKRAVDIILRRIYHDRVILTNLKKTYFEETYLRHMYQNCLLLQQQVLPTKSCC